MNFDGFYGNAHIKEYLSSAVDSNRISHAYMFSGAKGIGKKTLGNIFARALVCAGNDKPCGVCSECRKTAHPDIIQVFPRAKTKGAEEIISVETVREIKKDAYVRPNDAERKVYIINQADKMRLEAQNAFLKILEEPPAFTVFILLCYNEENMLETVRSRCVRFTLSGVSVSDAKACLRAKNPSLSDDELHALAVKTNGVIGSLEASDESDEHDDKLKRLILALSERDKFMCVAALCEFEKLKRPVFKKVIDKLTVCVRDALIGEPICHSLWNESRNLRERLSKPELMEILATLDGVQGYIRRNVGVAHITGNLSVLFTQNI